MSPRSSKSKSRSRVAAPPDVYVALLFVSVAALIVGIIFLVMELGNYDWRGPSGAAGSAAPPAVSAALDPAASPLALVRNAS